ncbi:MAG TPA: hypothetical protein VL442_10715 [Mucilaginibacter sp.]|jgi:hypothetical protein|nr:hypothetical protein [Mucilaginibacter sp.]
MGKLSIIGRIFYGIAIAGFGALMIYYHDFPYMLLPPNHTRIPGFAVIAIIWGILFVLAGACLIFEKKPRLISLLLAAVLLLIFCFYYIPYEFMATSNYMHLGEWENGVKDLTLAGGALVIAGCFPEKNENRFIRLLGKLIPFGAILFALTMIDYGISHFLYAKDAADYVPAWIPGHLFWIYFCGAALLGSGIAIILKIKTGLIATLLGTMIFIWFISLHMPRVIVSSAADMDGEVTSAFLALAYSGIAFVIAGTDKKIA